MFSGIKAQSYVTIPDPNFVTFLQSNYPGCMSGNQMDTTCLTIINDLSVTVSGSSISNLNGIQYFDNLQSLTIINSLITILPSLPYSIKNLTLYNNRQLTAITSFPVLLEHLICVRDTLLSSIPPLPSSITYMDFSANNFSSLPALPASLDSLFCQLNALTSLPSLPSGLTYLNCEQNQLTGLPTLSPSLKHAYCGKNFLTTLPVLPSSLLEFNCRYNQLTAMPIIPSLLGSLGCDHNFLSSLPVLPSSLRFLICNNNNLSFLPSLPDTLIILVCDSNQISCFPHFPFTLGSMWGISGISIHGNPFSCLPNYVISMDPPTLAYPLCVPDSIVNPFNCDGADAIYGFTYLDVDGNCLWDTSDIGVRNIHLMKYDTAGTIINQTYSTPYSLYTFASNDTGVYTIKIDTMGMPYTFQCVAPGIDSSVNITAASSSMPDVNFNITCKPGFDIGVQSITTTSIVFPGLPHTLNVFAGDMSHWYGLDCSAGTGGQVEINISGPVTYSGIPSGALTPFIGPATFIYNIADFGSIDNSTAFRLMLSTDTTAQSGDTICVTVSVTPEIGDINPNNNIYHFCYLVRNSLDPNIKETYPVNVMEGFEDYFTYTIHFQNTGMAPAQRVMISDRLDSNLVVETFQVINYSHNNTVSLEPPSWGWGNELTFRFSNIMLPDSASDPEGSKGFVQYRIKPRANLPTGTLIHNQALIFFDYNSFVATNETINEFMMITSVNENVIKKKINVYPNPGAGVFKFENIGSSGILEVYDICGRQIYKMTIKENIQSIDLTGMKRGLYFYKVINEQNEIRQGKIILQ